MKKQFKKLLLAAPLLISSIIGQASPATEGIEKAGIESCSPKDVAGTSLVVSSPDCFLKGFLVFDKTSKIAIVNDASFDGADINQLKALLDWSDIKYTAIAPGLTRFDFSKANESRIESFSKIFKTNNGLSQKQIDDMIDQALTTSLVGETK